MKSSCYKRDFVFNMRIYGEKFESFCTEPILLHCADILYMTLLISFMAIVFQVSDVALTLLVLDILQVMAYFNKNAQLPINVVFIFIQMKTYSYKIVLSLVSIRVSFGNDCNC